MDLHIEEIFLKLQIEVYIQVGKVIEKIWDMRQDVHTKYNPQFF
jgi:hypothetical protein